MTLVSERPPALAPSPVRSALRPSRPDGSLQGRPLTLRRGVLLGLCWLLVAVTSLGVAAVVLGSLAESRSQHGLLSDLRQRLSFAEAASRSVLSSSDPVPLPATGDPVALLQVPRLGLQRVVVEGARPRDTQAGPGHVPGSAGLGQPGNAAVVGRRAAYGGAFLHLDRLRTGDAVVVTTVQGQSVYRVSGVRRTGADVVGPSKDNRLTLVTSAGASPTSSGRALVVTAELEGQPFAPTAQGARSPLSDGAQGDGSAWPTVLIWATLLLAAAGATAGAYRRWFVRSTYLLTTPALLALVVLLADAGTRLLPAWV